MGIQVRRGNKGKLEPDRLQPGEFAVALDTDEVGIKSGGGMVWFATLDANGKAKQDPASYGKAGGAPLISNLPQSPELVMLGPDGTLSTAGGLPLSDGSKQNLITLAGSDPIIFLHRGTDSTISFTFEIPLKGKIYSVPKCDKFANVKIDVNGNVYFEKIPNTLIGVAYTDTDDQVRTKISNYFADNPVTVLYELASPVNIKGSRHYTVYPDGRLHEWGYVNDTITITSAYGSMYLLSHYNITLQHNFVGNVSAHINIDSAGALVGSGAILKSGTQNVLDFRILSPISVSNLPVNIFYDVWGWWRT